MTGAEQNRIDREKAMEGLVENAYQYLSPIFTEQPGAAAAFMVALKAKDWAAMNWAWENYPLQSNALAVALTEGRMTYEEFEVEDAEKIFNTISALIVESINKTGNIDPVAIYQKVTEKHDMYKHTEAIVLRLFEHQQNINIVNKYFRARNPSALSEKTSIQPIFQTGMGWQQLNERRRQLEEEKKQLMEVIERNGQVEIVPARKR